MKFVIADLVGAGGLSTSQKMPWVFKSRDLAGIGRVENIATSHDLGPQKVAKEGKCPSFREI